MDNIIKYEDKIKEIVYDNALILFAIAYLYDGLKVEIPLRKFEVLNNDMFSNYRHKNTVYNYVTDMNMLMEHSLALAIESGKKSININDFIEGMYDYRFKVDKDNNAKPKTIGYEISKKRGR